MCGILARDGPTPNMYCVYGGKEPLQFTNRFACWEAVEEASVASTLDNRPSTLEDMQLCFQRLSKSVYTFEELQQRPLPDGVNPNKLETYLSDKEFYVSWKSNFNKNDMSNTHIHVIV